MDDQAPRLTVAAVAHRLGVAPATLRTWDRRYGVGPTQHSAGSHRRYSPADIARLRTMRQLILEGVPPSEAARVALGEPFLPPGYDQLDGPGGRSPAQAPSAAGPGLLGPDLLGPDLLGPDLLGPDLLGPDLLGPDLLDAVDVLGDPDVPGVVGPVAGARAPASELPLPATAAVPGGRPGGPGGQVLALPGADAVVRGLGRAVMALDAAVVTGMLREQIARNGVLHTWDHVMRPVLVAVGARWAATGQGVEVEHMLSDCAAAVLRSVSEGVVEPPSSRPVLLACAPEEQHALPLHALGAGLAERGVATRTLGPAMPALALSAAVRRTGPAALFLWSQRLDTGTEDVFRRLPRTRPATVVVVGGPGWDLDRMPERVGVASDLPHAMALVERALVA